MMNKYVVRIGEFCLERIEEYYTVYSKMTKEELENDEMFLYAVDSVIESMYYDYGEDDEDFEDFQDSMGIIEIRDFREDDSDYEILYDERP